MGKIVYAKNLEIKGNGQVDMCYIQFVCSQIFNLDLLTLNIAVTYFNSTAIVKIKKEVFINKIAKRSKNRLEPIRIFILLLRSKQIIEILDIFHRIMDVVCQSIKNTKCFLSTIDQSKSTIRSTQKSTRKYQGAMRLDSNKAN